MAKMIPMEFKCGEYLCESEREVFEILKEGLSDEWVVIYSLRWITDDEVFLNKSNGECDFILIHRDYGVMILEVKGGIISCINGEWTSISANNIKSNIQDPEKQANSAKYNLMARFRRSGVSPYVTTAVWFPDCITENYSLPLSMPKEIILDMTSFQKIEEKIINIFKFRASKEGFIIKKLTDSEYNKVLYILNPKVDIKMPLLRLSNKLNMKFMRLNDEQNLCFEQLDENKFISVKGHAGTGKTVLAVKKAFRESERGKKVLFLCYNDLLMDKIKEESNGKFRVDSIYKLAEDYLKMYNDELYKKFQSMGDYNEMMSDFLKEVKGNKDKERVVFDSILIDEGQDFTEEWFNGINELLSSDGTLCVFYDENQNLYNKYGRRDTSFLEKGTKYTLKRNMRNTDEICLSSLNVINADRNSIKLNGVNGIKPDIIFSEDSFDTLIKLNNTIRELKHDEYLMDENIAVLTMEAKKKVRLKKGIDDNFKGTVESIRRFKGLESDVVIIPDLKHDFMNDEDLRNILYVGMSRAKTHVILIVDIESLTRKQASSFKKEIKEKLL